MANLHNIKPNDNQIKVKDLYHKNANITIKLKPHISPQHNAEKLYRKFKNQKLEINNITENITRNKFAVQSPANFFESASSHFSSFEPFPIVSDREQGV